MDRSLIDSYADSLLSVSRIPFYNLSQNQQIFLYESYKLEHKPC